MEIEKGLKYDEKHAIGIDKDGTPVYARPQPDGTTQVEKVSAARLN